MSRAIVLLIALTAWLYPIKAVSAEIKGKTQVGLTVVNTPGPEKLTKKEPKAEAPSEPTSAPTPKPAPKNPVLKPHYSAEANGDIQIRMKAKVIAKWGEGEWPGMHYILDYESGSDPYAKNPNSTACGIPQATPCSKMLAVIGSLDNVEGQLDWMVNYVAARYKTPTGAMEFHKVHNWY